jgi:tape measure domain-containing protein
MAQVRDIFVTLGFDVDSKDLDNLDRSLKNIQGGVKSMTVLFAGASIAIGGFLRIAGKMEQTEIAFETLTGSVETAKDLINGLKEDARKTPFTIPGILDQAKLLLAYQRPVKSLREDISILGNIAAGVGKDKLPFLTLAFGQVATTGRLQGQEIRQFAQAGVPLISTIAESLGKTKGEVQALSRQGKISFEDMREALVKLTTGTGMFANLMEKQSRSFFGVLSNIEDLLIDVSISIGKELLPQAKAIANEFLTLLEINRKLIRGRFVKFFKSISVTMGILFKVAKATVEAILNVTDAMGGLETVIKAVAFAMIAFTGLNILAAIGGVTVLIFKLIKGFKILGVTIRATQASALLMPILIGAAVIALGLIIEDIIGFFRGKDSITGLIVEAFEKKFPEAFLATQAALFAIKETVGIVIDEFKLLFGFLDEFLIKDPLKAARDVLSLDAFEGAAKFIFGAESNPSNSPASGGGQGASININAPVSVEVPAGTPPALVGESITEVIERVFGGIVRQASSATEPVTEY